MELKLAQVGDLSQATAASNCTNMELKLLAALGGWFVISPSNCTNMELKPPPGSEDVDCAFELLIAPIWN